MFAFKGAQGEFSACMYVYIHYVYRSVCLYRHMKGNVSIQLYR